MFWILFRRELCYLYIAVTRVALYYQNGRSISMRCLPPSSPGKGHGCIRRITNPDAKLPTVIARHCEPCVENRPFRYFQYGILTLSLRLGGLRRACLRRLSREGTTSRHCIRMIRPFNRLQCHYRRLRGDPLHVQGRDPDAESRKIRLGKRCSKLLYTFRQAGYKP
jgi:hypothetical protein